MNIDELRAVVTESREGLALLLRGCNRFPDDIGLRQQLDAARIAHAELEDALAEASSTAGRIGLIVAEMKAKAATN